MSTRRIVMIKEKITALLPQNDKKTKKKIENLLFTLILLIITLFIVKNIFKSKEIPTRNTAIDNEVKIKENEKDLETELEKILKRIKQIDDVDVLLTYSESESYVPIYNENSSTSKTLETDNTGGERTVENLEISKEVAANKENEPITEKIILPKIEGAIIVIKGEITTETKNNVIQAVSATTGLAVHKIQILEMK